MNLKFQQLGLRIAMTITVILLFMCVNSFAQTVPELIYYKFDDSGTSVSNSASAPVGTNPATLVGSLTQGGVGQFVGALQGTGTSSATNYLDTGWPANLSSTGFTISMWMNNMDASTSIQYLFGDNTAGSFRCFINGVAGIGNIILRGGGLTDCVITGIASGPTVVHFVYTGTQILGYKNGVLVTTVNDASISIMGTGTFKVGGYYNQTGMPDGSQIDEFRVYNRALDAAEIAATWNIELPGDPVPVPVSPWAVVFGIFLIALFVIIVYIRRIA